jgi:hypothetical protein
MRPNTSGNGGIKQLSQITNAADQQAAASGNAFAPLPNGTDSALGGNILPPPGVISSSTKVAFADVPPDQAGQPIVATGNEKIPSELVSGSILSQFQSEVAKVRAEKDAKDKTGVAATETAATADTPLTPEALKKELDNIRRTLADKPSTKFDPSEMMDTAKKAMNDATAQSAGTSGADTSAAGRMAMPKDALLPPPDSSSGKSAALLPPPELYAKNPKNLPIVNEPVTNAPSHIRTLADFPEASSTPLAEPNKIAIPSGLRPSLSATEFPKIEILSYIPGKGVIAYANGREGVLLLGENINGWELASVSNDNAEFRSGRQTRTVTPDSAAAYQ